MGIAAGQGQEPEHDHALAELAVRHGVATSFVDGVGARRTPADETLVAVLAALGVPITAPEQAAELLKGEEAAPPACHVAAAGVPVIVETALPDGTAELVLELEGRDAPVTATVPVHDGLVDAGILDDGVHRVELRADGVVESSWWIIAPQRCHPGPLPPRTWGMTAPLASLRRQSGDDVGLGDLTGLGELGDTVAKLGGSIVATLPLVASAPDEDSPYSPVTRRFWDERWVDPVAIAERIGVDPPTLRTASVDRAVPMTDAVAAVRAALAELHEHAPADEIDAWADTVPDLDAYARWRAAGFRYGFTPADWPDGLDAELRGEQPLTLLDEQQVAFERFAQWCAFVQLKAIDDRDDYSLYLDLPLGLADHAFDSWMHPELFAQEVSIGAPPDRFFPWGQRWDLAPLLPTQSAADGHRYLRQCLEAHASVCGLLRIDHVMGLHRQFWLPDGAPDGEGTYVTYPADQIWALVRLVSHRTQCGIVGEDLGVVPDEVRAAMNHNGVRGLYIAQDETRWPFRLQRPVPGPVIASLNTHDLAPVAAWWAEQAPEGLEQTLPGTVRDHLIGELGVSGADVVLVSDQDLTLDPTRFNLPGTISADNWRLRSKLPVAELRSGRSDLARDARRVLADLAEWRRTDYGRLPDQWLPMVDTEDIRSFAAGTHARIAARFGAHPITVRGTIGAEVTVWAPNAQAVAIAGDFNGFHPAPMHRYHHGLWHLFVPGAVIGDHYKFHVTGQNGWTVEKADPLARASEPAPGNASIITWTDPGHHDWGDADWMERRAATYPPKQPMSIYELHPPSWRQHEDGSMLNWRELAPLIVDYQRELGFTHVELMAVMEYPFGGSWGYHVTGYFSPTSRHGTPQDFAYFVDELHQAGIGVILDWVPAHFPVDSFGLAYFDGGPLYEYADPRIGEHREWGSLVFDYGRNEVRSFLVSSARWWLEQYHIDGLRVDAVAAMLFRDYAREEGDWIPNIYGGRENLEAIEFIKQMTTEIHHSLPGALVIAEESTSWQGVTAGTDHGGLGFDLKWDLGWMHDTLDYLERDPVHRNWHQNELSFRAMYHDSERFVLPLSHDEVVHGKGSLLGKMAGDRWQQLGSLRLLYGHQFTMPGVPLLFQGAEIAAYDEWDYTKMPPWFVLDYPEHRGIQAWVAALNELLRSQPALYLHEGDHGGNGFEWIDCTDSAHSAFVWLRRGYERSQDLVIAATFTPSPLQDYRIGLPDGGAWRLALSSDEQRFGGSGYPTVPAITGEPPQWSNRPYSALVNLPPLGMVIYERDGPVLAGGSAS